MAFDNRFYAAAEAELNRIRQKDRNTEEMRLEEIKLKFPDIYALRTKLSGTSAKLLSAIADRDGNISEKLAEIEKDNLSLREQLWSALVSRCYPQDYLEPVCECKKCRDTGVIDGKRCSCFMDMVKKASAEEINRSSPLRLCTFNEFSLSYYDDSTPTQLGATARKIMEVNLSACIKYAEDFHIPYGGLLMRGKTGLGKTHLSLSIASAVIEKGYNVIYISAPDLMRMIEKEHFGNSPSDADTLGMVIKADLLVLDDVGAEFDTKFNQSAFYNIINDRMNASLPTIISTNLDHSELPKRYGERIYSRISTMEELVFVGSDVRVKKTRLS